MLLVENLRDGEKCRLCGERHGPQCPIVKAMEFDPESGAVVRIEYVTAADFPHMMRPAPAAGAETPAGGEYPRKKPE